MRFWTRRRHDGIRDRTRLGYRGRAVSARVVSQRISHFRRSKLTGHGYELPNDRLSRRSVVGRSVWPYIRGAVRTKRHENKEVTYE